MNKFERVQEGDKLFLKVTTEDGLGNMNITFKYCTTELEFTNTVEAIYNNLETKLKEVKEQLKMLPLVKNTLETELDNILKIK